MATNVRSETLTERQQRLLAFLLDFLLHHHRQPTCREIAAAVGYVGAPGAAQALKSLVRKGHLLADGEGKRWHWKLAHVELRAERVAADWVEKKVTDTWPGV